MSYTRANLEFLLIKRVGAFLTRAGLDGVTISGSNADLNDPLGYALRKSGYLVAVPNAVSSTDVAAVSESDLDKVLDFAEYRALSTVRQNLLLVDTRVGPRDSKFSQLIAQLKDILEEKSGFLSEQYGFDDSEMEEGIIGLDIADHEDAIA